MSWFGDLAGGALGFLAGGPFGAAIGAGLGEAATGGSGGDILKAGGLGYLGGEFLPGLFGGDAAGLAALGGAEAGFTSGAGLGLSPEAVSQGIMGIGGETGFTELAPSLSGAGAATSAADPWYKQLFGKLGLGDTSLNLGGTAGATGGGLFGNIPKPLLAGLGGMQVLGGLQQYQAGRAQMNRQEQFANQLAALEANPSLAMSSPQGILAARAAARSAAPLGGNPALAGAEAAGGIYSQRARELASLSGSAIPYSSPMTGLGSLGLGGYALMSGLA